MVRGRLIFVSGGVRSGKSAFAESLVRKQTARKRVYIASGRGEDPEMNERISRHREDRKHAGWQTFEAPVDMERTIPLVPEGSAVLWDCVTTWLANELYEGWEEGNPCAEVEGCMEQKWLELQQSIEQLLGRVPLLVIVSNEVLDEPVADAVFQSWLGRIHIWLAGEAIEAFEMENGLAFRRK